jgi:hypothetical protein
MVCIGLTPELSDPAQRTGRLQLKRESRVRSSDWLAMFSVNQKRQIADAVQKILRDTNHPELPKGEIQFSLHVEGAESWSWADIRNNGMVTQSDMNSWNEMQDPNVVKHG